MSEPLEINAEIENLIGLFLKVVPFSYVTIDFNYAEISIEPAGSAKDRGRFRVLADHKTEFVDKCYIDYYDGFPRYYFNFDCMIKEIKSWITARENLVIKDIRLVADNSTIKNFSAIGTSPMAASEFIKKFL